MVLWCHTYLFRKPGWDDPLVRSGWAGVDLFFVLSGFLISGLLFSEYKRSGGIRFRRFAARRALKLYPALYVLIALTVVLRLAGHREPMSQLWRGVRNDVFFMQSYTPGTYPHFWSLSVEEHFYVLLPLALYFMLRRTQAGARDPFRLLPWIFTAVAILEIALRLWTAHQFSPFDFQTHASPTHLRMDSLLFGVVLSYWSNFHGERFWKVARARSRGILAVAAILILPIFIVPQTDSKMYTVGFTTTYLGFGALLVASLTVRIETLSRGLRGLFRALAYVGTFSYSIYLWHFAWLNTMMRLHVTAVPYLGGFVYFTGAIAVGIAASKLVEMPVLRLRDRFFPSAAGSPGRRPRVAQGVGLADAPAA